MKDYSTHSMTISDNFNLINNKSNNSNSNNNNTLSINSAQRYRYQNEIQAMMYTFGDVRNPLPGTTMLVEDIVHSQMIELVKII